MATPKLSIQALQAVYFLGIGGIGMSAIARWFLNQNIPVFGYDKTETPLTATLAEAGMHIHYTDNIQNIPTQFISNPENTLVIYTPAIPADHQEKNYFLAQNITLYKRSEILGWLVSHSRNISVAGTHGKTSTSSMIAHICYQSGQKLTAFLGGITQNYQTNFITTPERSGEELMVVEADEYDRSFLTLHPHTAIITSTDADHLDIYQKHESLLESFQLFANQIVAGGHLLLKHNLQIHNPKGTDLYTYGINQGYFQARNLTIENSHFIFDWYKQEEKLGQITLQIPGNHNVENALAAASACYLEGIEPQKICKALATCKGVVRRFQYHYQSDKLVIIDDYAHHPTEITAFLQALKMLYPTRRIVAIFQPHLFTRTRDFAAGFSESLSLADVLYLLPIYPARELPIEGITSAMLLQAITSPQKFLIKKQDLISQISLQPGDILATIGAGDIDTLVAPLAKYAIEISETW